MSSYFGKSEVRGAVQNSSSHSIMEESIYNAIEIIILIREPPRSHAGPRWPEVTVRAETHGFRHLRHFLRRGTR
jgi:hypothetical protein